ncbi:calcium-translocating P-type ATPase, PMCA-type [Enterococcus moraviensis ATCC BAA-383]|uniref:Calcium-translocating P-type ATPase, PMCA-type n=1 Tax=Enterococcus moraviensis ATCC BAA-383 TaxID=1158609 RepID=R2TNQ3_9ENTE|nr:HAD-IC family P-type ATPase [Enterococcus moraviensis]EOI01782.1 calcium-translocating P-type ATPase, PMCA-type [Enterococcus moraviensis ATCC BAA-383]EOT73683.1 calcium-translocating P-type ATPase, PMCA-type [Enterococcus moraviensis ATCC BAA-383]OJG69243.1 calcium-translocating P-type ATPase, PMCA-type [Enterococcus moraviensis]
MNWYQMTTEQVLTALQSNLNGLDRTLRKVKQEEGSNALSKEKEVSKLQKFLHHFHDLLIYVLLVSAVLKGVSGHFIDMAIILLVVIINAVIGYVQEAKATDSLESLTSMMSSEAVVLIEGEKETVKAESLVAGDLVYLSPGDIVPADLRVIEAYNLVIDEAILTGESTPVEKNSLTLEEEADLGDHFNMAYSGTLINSGTGKGIVVQIGDQTEIGKINQHLKSVGNNETPLIKKMKQLNKQIFLFLMGLIVFLVLFSLFFRELSASELLSSMIALAVSAVPEGLPAVLSIILSVGVTRMARQHAIIKKMPAVETLGSMGVICSDKTGTLTKNEMEVVALVTSKETIDTAINGAESIQQVEQDEALRKMAEVASYCNDTKITYKNGVREVIGNPTEGALLDWSNHTALVEEEHDISKIPFDSSYKYMATLVDIQDKRYIYLKGAPDVLLNMVDYQLAEGKAETFNEEYWQQKISHQAKKGQRILAAAFKEVTKGQTTLDHEDLKSGMILAGLFGIIDPPKKEAIEAVRISRKAGISVKMITGDHKDTAVAIAKEIGLENYQNALVGKEIEQLSDEELAEVVLTNDVYARTTPEHKLRLVNAIQKNGQIVGMTGDGVNDAPALKQADIGIAMGIKGTEVTKDAADMVLADDNFATITVAIKEGRRVYENLKKTIYFSLPTAFAQGLLVVVSLLLDRPLPLTSVQILWLNMVTTITLSFALGFEPLAKNGMNQPPRNPKENILDRYAVFRIVYVSLLLAALGFLVNGLLENRDASEAVMQTTLITTIVFGQIFYMINCREIYQFSINKSILSNKVLWLSLLVLFILQALLVYTPIMHLALGTATIGWAYLKLAFLSGIVVFVVVEFEKLLTRKLKKDSI